MSSLRGAAGQALEGQIGFLSERYFRPKTLLGQTVAQLPPVQDVVELPAGLRLDRVREKLGACVKSGSFTSLDKRDWRLTPWVMWEKPLSIADDNRFLDALFRFISDGWPRSVIKGLLGAYLRYFDPSRSSFGWVAGLLKTLALPKVSTWGERWLDIDLRFQIFNVPSGPGTLAYHVLRSPEGPAGLAEAGFDGDRLTGAFCVHAYQAALTRVSEELASTTTAGDTVSHFQRIETIAHLDRLLTWSKDGSALRFPALGPALAGAVLLPFADRNVPDGVAELIVPFLKEHLGDPRMKLDRWAGVPKEAINVMRRLLIRSTLEDFFKVISETAERRHWEARRRFWFEYQKAGHIVEAWVAFGPRARSKASALESDTDYGVLDGASEKTHSAVFMRIRDVVICEWSHNGRCRFYPTGTKQWVPPLYRRRYDYDELHHRCTDYLTHQGEHWQQRFARHIFELTGVMHPRLGRGWGG